MNYLVCGYLGYDNLGDELMAEAISSSVFKGDKDAHISFFSPKGRTYRNLKCVNRHSPIQILKSINKCDVFILGGGTLISEEASKRSAFYYALVLLSAKIMKKKIVITSGGIDRIESRSLKKLFKKTLKNASFSLRDTPSLDALWEIVPCRLAKIHADLVFLTAQNYIYKAFCQNDRKCIVICLKSGAPKDIGIMIGELCKIYSLTPVFAATSPSDIEICSEQSRLINGSTVLLTDIESAVNLFKKAYLCLSMRYHGLLLAACLGCIPISMSSSEKIISLMRELNLDQLILESAYSYKKYMSTMSNVIENYNIYENLCKTNVKKMLRRAKLAEAFLADLNRSEQ